MKNVDAQSSVLIEAQIGSLLQDAKDKEIKEVKKESLLEAIEVMNMNICNDKKRDKLGEIADNQTLRVDKIESKYKQ